MDAPIDRRTRKARRRGRELATQMLAAWDANPMPPAETVAMIAGITRAGERHLGYAQLLANVVWNRIDEIDAALAEAAGPYWREHMGRVERSVLRVAVAELLAGTAPPAVAVSEAIGVARLYAGAAAAPFVHGVLDRVARGLAGFSGGAAPEPTPEAAPDAPAAPEPASTAGDPPGDIPVVAGASAPA